MLHWEFDHFVVVTRVSRRRIVIHDPAAGRRVLDWTQFGDAFTGVAVEFTRAHDFVGRSSRLMPSRGGLVRSFQGLPRYLVTMLILLIATQLLSLAPPVATQLLIDEVVLGQDRLWLHRVIAGLALVMLAAVLIDMLRRRIALYTGMRIATDSTSLVVRHLLRLPAATVGHRSVGDLMSRVDSMQPLRVALTDTTLRLVVQGTVMLATLALMLVYSKRLTVIYLLDQSLSIPLEHRKAIDEHLSRLATHWSLTRMAVTDRNILRLGAYEILYGDTPGRVAVNEAIILAKRYGDKNSQRFVNGILDRLLKDAEEGNVAGQQAAEADQGSVANDDAANQD